MVALFDNLDALLKLDAIIRENMPMIKNREDIFGEQRILNENDEEIGKIDNLLVTACMLDVHKVVEIVRLLGGVIFPAHIDKDSYNIVSNLGFIPEELEFSTVEIKDPGKINYLSLTNRIDKFLVVHNSDAHYLWDIHEKEYFIDVEELSLKKIIDKLSKGL